MRSKIALIISFTAACGGAQKSGGTTGPTAVNSAPPPPVIGGAPGDQAPEKVQPKVEVSKDERADYQAAFQFFDQNEKNHSWDEAACKSAADKFSSVSSAHAKLVVAQVMVGTSYARCGMWGDAEKAYLKATQIQGGDPVKEAQALSNLGEIYYRQGKVEGARQYWENALKTNGKLVGARVGLASLDIAQMHQINNPKDKHWQDLEQDARQNLSNALGVDSDNVAAYTAYGDLYMEGWEQNKNRLLLAKLLLDEAKQRNEKDADLQNAYGQYYMDRGSLNQALGSFSAAVDADPKFIEARINAGFLNLGFRKYDVAKDLFAKVLEIAPKNYDAVIGLGIALRGTNDLDGAEKEYKLAQQIDPQRGEAFYNLGVLYKDFRANKQNDQDPIKALQASQGVYRQARQFFQDFIDKTNGSKEDKAEAKNNIGDCEKVVKQLDQAITSLKNAPPPTPPPAPPPATPPAPAAGSGAAPAAPAAPPATK